MGALVSRFRGKQTTRDLLEKIEIEIQKIEDYKWSALRQQKNVVGLLFFVSGFLYIISALMFYFYYLPRSSSMIEKCLYCLPLFLFPPLVYTLKRSLHWYFRWIIDSKEDRLIDLRKEKKKLLAKVMDTETYKVAKELLEKYDPSALKDKNEPQTPKLNYSMNSSLRYRGSPPRQGNPPMNTSFNSSQNPILQTPIQRPNTNNRAFNAQLQMTPHGANMRPALPMPRLPRPVLPQDRGMMDKLVDYIVGDGPTNRYALVCNRCSSHNGMALKDEFEFIAFRCCYCYQFNPARKDRPFAPRIMPPPSSGRPSLAPVVDEPESDSDSKDVKKVTPGYTNDTVNIVDVSSDISNEESEAKCQESMEKSSEQNLESESIKNSESCDENRVLL